MRGAGGVPLWAAVWLTALAVPFVEARWLVPAAALGWLSAAILAPERFHGRRLVKLAAAFLAFWAAFLSLIHLVQPSTLKPVVNLAVWLALGLNLMLAKTPLELALSAGRILTPVLGRRNGQKLALSLALLARLIPRLLSASLDIKTVVGRRAAHLPFTARLTLWGRAAIRDAMSQSEELARALVKRWPW
ncbi:MAG: hypothetical protein LBV79_09455 [Candidatus Adiutrix sp.]|jgi:hypothetical protein|nr:hypothetical protein [Candidatus Adiutrix sp.]